MRNPNRFRAVLGSFAGHMPAFHMPDGSGYDLLADWLIKLDPINPQTTAGLTAVFDTWTHYDPARQTQMRAALQRILNSGDVSRDTTEMVNRILAA